MSERPLSVVHAIARLNVGGAALNVLGLAAEQRRRGHDVIVVAGTLADGEESMEYVATETSASLSCTCRRCSASCRYHAMPLRLALSAASSSGAAPTCCIPTLPRRARPGGSQLSLPAARNRARRCTRFTGTSCAGTSTGAASTRSSVSSGCWRRRTRSLVAVSDEVRDDLVTLGVAPRGKIVVIPYGFDLSGLGRPDDEERARRRAESRPTRSCLAGRAA